MPALLRFTGSVEHSPAIDEWLATRPGDLGAIARAWFSRMRECGTDVRELMHDGCPTVCVDDAGFACVGVYRAHVNVGFFQGASLPDPASLLQGSGKFMRHVKIKPGLAMDDAALEALITAAHRDIVVRLKSAE